MPLVVALPCPNEDAPSMVFSEISSTRSTWAEREFDGSKSSYEGYMEAGTVEQSNTADTSVTSRRRRPEAHLRQFESMFTKPKEKKVSAKPTGRREDKSTYAAKHTKTSTLRKDQEPTSHIPDDESRRIGKKICCKQGSEFARDGNSESDICESVEIQSVLSDNIALTAGAIVQQTQPTAAAKSTPTTRVYIESSSDSDSCCSDNWITRVVGKPTTSPLAVTTKLRGQQRKPSEPRSIAIPQIDQGDLSDVDSIKNIEKRRAGRGNGGVLPWGRNGQLEVDKREKSDADVVKRIRKKKAARNKDRVVPWGRTGRLEVDVDSYPENDSDVEEWQDHQKFSPARDKYCSMNTFCQLWETVEDDIGELTVDIENGKLVREANHRVAGSRRQANAMYGRVSFKATDRMLDLLELQHPSSSNEGDVFVDFGHGLGNAVMQAAFTRRCCSRGIEIDATRFYLSSVYRTRLYEAYEKLWIDRDGISFRVRDNFVCAKCWPLQAYSSHFDLQPGPIHLRRGRLESTEQTAFLTEGGRIKGICNNYNGVFGPKAMHSSTNLSLDENMIGLFGLMVEGSILITLSKLNFVVSAIGEI